MGGWGGVVVSALDFRSEGRWFDAQSLQCVVSSDKKLYPRLSLSTQVYKMGTGDILLGVTPSRREYQYYQLLHATETGISSGQVGLLGSRATLSTFTVLNTYTWRFRACSPHMEKFYKTALVIYSFTIFSLSTTYG